MNLKFAGIERSFFDELCLLPSVAVAQQPSQSQIMSLTAKMATMASCSQNYSMPAYAANVIEDQVKAQPVDKKRLLALPPTAEVAPPPMQPQKEPSTKRQRLTAPSMDPDYRTPPQPQIMFSQPPPIPHKRASTLLPTQPLGNTTAIDHSPMPIVIEDDGMHESQDNMQILGYHDAIPRLGSPSPVQPQQLSQRELASYESTYTSQIFSPHSPLLMQSPPMLPFTQSMADSQQVTYPNEVQTTAPVASATTAETAHVQAEMPTQPITTVNGAPASGPLVPNAEDEKGDKPTKPTVAIKDYM